MIGWHDSVIGPGIFTTSTTPYHPGSITNIGLKIERSVWGDGSPPWLLIAVTWELR